MLYLVFLLSVTVSSFRPELFRNPRELVHAYSHANVDTINVLLNKITDLRLEGKEELERINTLFNESNKTKNEAQSAYDAALEAKNEAQRSVQKANTTKIKAQRIWETLYADANAAKVVSDRSKEVYRQKRDFKAKILTRTNAEAKDFISLQDLLKNLYQVNTGQDVDKIDEMVTQMKNASEVEAQNATDEASNANQTFHRNLKIYDDFNIQQANAKSSLTSESLVLDAKINELTNSKQALASASVSLKQANSDLGDATKLRDVTKRTVERDDSILAQVVTALNHLHASQR